MRVLVQHASRYRYPRPATLGAHEIRLRPAAHARARIESYGLTASGAQLAWQQDPAGNFVAHATWEEPTEELEILVELAVDIHPVNPFDFTLDASAASVPFSYGALSGELAPYLALDDEALARGPRFDALALSTSPAGAATVAWLVELNRVVAERTRYVVREELGIWTPEETLAEGRGSCRDSAVLLVALLRTNGLAARFVSGYLVQLTDEGMLPDEPKGVTRDVADLHAWAEVFLPGAGWIGLDATSGLLTGEGHIPLACTATPSRAAPIDGTSDVLAEAVTFEMRALRLGHEVRPTAPFTDEAWAALAAAGAKTDAALARLGLRLTIGGEPTFNSRLHPELPEWNGEALGRTKWTQGLAFARELLTRLLPGGVMMLRQGKAYPGETLPRWTLELFGRRDGVPLWSAREGERGPGQPGVAEGASDAALLGEARALAEEIAKRLGVAGLAQEAFEDARIAIEEESALPIETDPYAADLAAPEERRRLARWLDRGLATPAGFVLPLARREGVWVSERWAFRRERMYLLAGDAPLGLRLPLRSLSDASDVEPWEEDPIVPMDPRGREAAAIEKKKEDARIRRLIAEGKLPNDRMPAPEAAPRAPEPRVRTALSVEPRGGALCVFLPPLTNVSSVVELLAAIDGARSAVKTEVLLEGYAPPSSKDLSRLSVAPDPGVLEVNLPPVSSFDDHAKLVEQVFDAALRVGLHSEKYLLDGRQSGSGGGNHVTMGGRRPLESPFVKDPRLLASLITFFQHHPSLSYLFTGLFVGPTSQAPRLDEARHDALYEMEIALDRAFSPPSSEDEAEPPWLSDRLFRDLLVDVSGNTHRAEICIDKLFDHRTPHGRQGLVELRAFEMPPHPRMMSAQTELVRALVAALAMRPYRHPLVRWGAALHDRFLLPTFLWRDFEDVLAFLDARGLGHPSEVYRAFLELRCPVAGRLDAGGVTLEVRSALEPWPVLGEEPSGSATSRYVDSSVERIEVRAEGLVPERHEVLVNGHVLPLRSTGRAGEAAAGVRFRAWAPPHSLQAHLGVHHPLRFDILDRWAERSLGACAYHVIHPEGRGYAAQPLTRFEASARRAQRFTAEAPLRAPVGPRPATAHADTPWTLDLRRLPIDRPPPQPKDPA